MKKPESNQIESVVRNLLCNWLIFSIEKGACNDYLVQAAYALPVKFCPGCGIINPRLVKYGKKEVTKRLTTISVAIKTIRQRYKCKECGHTFWEPLPEIEHQTES